MIDRERTLRAMEGFLAQFDAANPKIALKVRHTYRVAGLCERIARDEGFVDEEVDAAWLAGMLHDIGRFVQLRDYDTFMDASSVSHAKLSERMLFEDGMISNFVDVDALGPALLDAVREAIARHSDWKLSDDLDGLTQRLCTLLRDADKVDIMRVNCEEPIDVIYPFSEDELYASALSPDVMAAFDSRSTVKTSLKRLPADFALGHCAFGWELEFPESKRIAIEQGYLRQLFDRPWQDPDTLAYFEGARDRMFAWLVDPE